MIPNFSNLLAQAIEGKSEAIYLWIKSSRNNQFEKRELDEALAKFLEIEKSENTISHQSNALYLAGIWNYYGIGNTSETNYEEAIKKFNAAIALDENAFALNDRAWMYEKGLGERVNYTKAITLYQQAIIKGNVSALYNRALMYEKGLGTRKNYFEAFSLYHKASEQGHANATFKLAGMFKEGLGGGKNYFQAFKFYNKAIELYQHNNTTTHLESIKKQLATLSKNTAQSTQTIINQLINTIDGTSMSGRFTTDSSSKKILMLQACHAWIGTHQSEQEILFMLAFLKSVCLVPRHPYNFLSKPHSSKELEQLINSSPLRSAKINAISFSAKEIHDLTSNKIDGFYQKYQERTTPKPI